MIQYTIRGVTDHMDDTLRRQAAREGTSLNSVVLDILKRGLSLISEPVRYDDLDDLAGTWVHDPEFDRAIEEMDVVDEEMWR